MRLGGGISSARRCHLRRILSMLQLVKTVGSTMRSSRQGDRIFRYFVLNSLAGLGVLEFLEQPRTYGDLLAQFGFVQNEYVEEVLATLLSDPENVISLDGAGAYVRNPSVRPPQLEELLASTDRRTQIVLGIAESLSGHIAERMREETIGVRELFERQNRRVVSDLQEMLGTKVYLGIRSASFAFVPLRDRRWLNGKTLLEIGCGTGLETADIWLRLKGDIQITAIDNVPGMLELAERDFEAHVHKLDPHPPRLTPQNRPRFELADAASLPYPNQSFDAAYWMLMLHWTAQPWKVIAETARLLRPGGLLFGWQPLRPIASPYMHLVIRSSRNSYGFFWREDYVNWLRQAGLSPEVTPVGIFLARKPSVA
jgi:ubiquinone/menaquinone biosynthesis C-methylase UbiE